MSNVTVKTLEVYLRRYGWSHYKTVREEREKEGLILTGWEAVSGRRYGLIIDPIEEKSVLLFHVPQLLSAPPDRTPSNYLLELLMALGQINYQIILGKFSYDPRDGEVRFSITIPTDKSNLTYEQFKHCLDVITLTMDRYHKALEEILQGKKTHRDIGAGEIEALLQLLRRLSESE